MLYMWSWNYPDLFDTRDCKHSNVIYWILYFAFYLCCIAQYSSLYVGPQTCYSTLQYGHKLERRMITLFINYSILDCVEDCLRTKRCQSVNYHQVTHFCQTNFENRTTESGLYILKPGWIYNAKGTGTR